MRIASLLWMGLLAASSSSSFLADIASLFAKCCVMRRPDASSSSSIFATFSFARSTCRQEGNKYIFHLSPSSSHFYGLANNSCFGRYCAFGNIGCERTKKKGKEVDNGVTAPISSHEEKKRGVNICVRPSPQADARFDAKSLYGTIREARGGDAIIIPTSFRPCRFNIESSFFPQNHPAGGDFNSRRKKSLSHRKS